MPGFLGRSKNADVAELADARGSGPRDRKVVGVQVPPSARRAGSQEPALFAFVGDVLAGGARRSTAPTSVPQKLLAVRAQVVRDVVMRGFLIGLSLSLAFIVGCVASSTRYGVPRAEAAAVVEQRWSYFCFEAANVDDVNFKANAAGMRGWDLVTSTTNPNGQMVWCFRQPRP